MELMSDIGYAGDSDAGVFSKEGILINTEIELLVWHWSLDIWQEDRRLLGQKVGLSAPT